MKKPRDTWRDKGNTLIRGDVKIEWTELGEGRSGDYNPSDKDDIELLRFDVSKRIKGKWEPLDDASYCTQFPVSATKEQRKAGLLLLMSELYDGVDQWPDCSVKKACEHCSWISLKSIADNAITLGRWDI